MKKSKYLHYFLSVFLLFTAIPAFAQDDKGKIGFGKIKLIPGITIEEVYDDNIYKGNGTNNMAELEETDWITRLTPSLLLNYPFTEEGSVSLGYQGVFSFYQDNDDNDWDENNIIFGLDYKAPGGFVLFIEDRHKDTEDPYGTDNDYKTGLPKTERWNNTLTTKAGYIFSNKLKAFTYCNYYKQDYDLDVDYSQDYDSYELGAGAEIKIFPKTWGFVRYHFGERDYFTHPVGTGSNDSNDSDFDWHRVNMGMTWDSRAKLSGELNFGYNWKAYDNAFDINGTRYEDKDTWIASTFVSFTATENTSLSLSISRALREVGSDTNEYFEDTVVGITLQQIFRRKYVLTAGASYGKNDYNIPINRQREDDNYKANIGVDYIIKEWLTAGVNYSYDKKDSNYVINDYTDNQFMLFLSMIYQ